MIISVGLIYMIVQEMKPDYLILSNGDKEWRQNGQLYRVDGPAIDHVNGDKVWFQHGKLHRVDGPAVEWSNGYKHWFYQDKHIDCQSQQEFEKLLKLKAFW
jgi:hypothetical protein